MVQFALIYDSARTPDPPTSIAALAAWIQTHPGRFTHDQQFTGMTFLKSVMYGLAGGVERFQGGFDEERYRQGRDRLFAWLIVDAAVLLEERRDLSSRRGGHASPLRERRDRFHDVEQPERGGHQGSSEGLPAAIQGAAARRRHDCQCSLRRHSIQRAQRGRRDGARQLPAFARSSAREAARRGVGRRHGAGCRDASRRPGRLSSKRWLRTRRRCRASSWLRGLDPKCIPSTTAGCSKTGARRCVAERHDAP